MQFQISMAYTIFIRPKCQEDKVYVIWQRHHWQSTKKPCCFHNKTFLVDYAPLFSFRLSSVVVHYRQTTRCDSLAQCGLRPQVAGSHRILISISSSTILNLVSPLPVVMVHPLVFWYYFFLWPFHKPAANGVQPKKRYKYTTINFYLDHCSCLFLRCSSVSE